VWNVLYIVVLYHFNVVFVITIGKLCQLATKRKPILTGPFEGFPVFDGSDWFTCHLL